MEKTDTSNPNPKRMGLSVQELKKKLGLDKIRTIRPPIAIKKDGKHLYQVAGYFYPLKPETIERLKIPSQRIMFEVDRDEWLQKMMKIWGKEDEKIDPEQYPWGYEK